MCACTCCVKIHNTLIPKRKPSLSLHIALSVIPVLKIETETIRSKLSFVLVTLYASFLLLWIYIDNLHLKYFFVILRFHFCLIMIVPDIHSLLLSWILLRKCSRIYFFTRIYMIVKKATDSLIL